MAESHEERDLQRRVEALTAERDAAVETSKKVAEASARAAMLILERNELLEEQSEKLREALAKAEEASRAKDEFMAKVGHELRTPMNGILGMLGFLLETELTDDQRNLATTSRDSARVLFGLIEDLLEFSRQSTSKVTVVSEPVDLWNVLEVATYSLLSRARDKGLFLGLEIDPAVPRWILGDATRLQQVLLNVIGNAVKFTSEGHAIVQVSSSSDPDEVCIRVADTGQGISEGDLERIFEPFEQVDNSMARNHGGTGIGLVICKGLLREMGGSIHVQSEPNVGSEFTIRIPSVSAQSQAPENGSLRFTDCLLHAPEHATEEILEKHLKSLGVRTVRTESWRDLLLAALRTKDRSASLVLIGCKSVERKELERALHDELSCSHVVLISPFGEDAPEGACVERVLHTPLRVTAFREMLLGGGEGVPRSPRSAPDPVSPSSSAEPPQAAAEFSGLRVLLVEDNRVNQLVARRVLEKLGCEVCIAENGQACLEILNAAAPEIILMDCQMPVMDGLEATRRIRELEGAIGETPILALTANVTSGDIRNCFDAGMDEHLGKPIDKELLVEALRTWRGGRRGRRTGTLRRAG
ncbi:MAG TPA: response regulator [Planctomycetes bacterium]|nr:response regulator [Planctomycetota bacterium]